MLDHATIDVFEKDPIACLFINVDAWIVMNQVVTRIDVIETVDPVGSAGGATTHPHARVTIAVDVGMRDAYVVVSHRDVGSSIHRYSRHSKSARLHVIEVNGVEPPRVGHRAAQPDSIAMVTVYAAARHLDIGDSDVLCVLDCDSIPITSQNFRLVPPRRWIRRHLNRQGDGPRLPKDKVSREVGAPFESDGIPGPEGRRIDLVDRLPGLHQ